MFRALALLAAVGPFGALAFTGGCDNGAGSSEDEARSAQTASGKKIGILFSSFGDVDSPDEAEDYVKRSLLDPDVAPIPQFLKPLIAELGWLLQGHSIKQEYRQIGGGTNYRAASLAQAKQIESLLRNVGLDVTAYTGFSFTYPFIADTMAQIQADGVQQLIVFNQGAQYSKVTQYINLRDVGKYLAAHPQWNVNVIGVRSFSGDVRFRNLVAQSVQHRLDTDFPASKAEDVCLFFPLHGLPVSLPSSGDPGIGQMQAVVQDMAQRFKGHPVYFGFQNHAELGSQWTQPTDLDVAVTIGKQSCPRVIINGRVCFTVDNLETLFDQAIAQRDKILATRPTATVVVEKMFGTEPAFAQYMTALTLEAIAGKGDLQTLR